VQLVSVLAVLYAELVGASIADDSPRLLGDFGGSKMAQEVVEYLRMI
jgi:hypothetical protein